jgi:hypothetical protein
MNDRRVFMNEHGCLDKPGTLVLTNVLLSRVLDASSPQVLRDL